MKFSVVIPVYNKADTICAALESVYSQTYSDYEIIIVDDGSKDNLNEAILNKLTPCVRIIHQKNSGVSVARNTGINNSSGDYICFLDADDLWKSNHLEELNRLIIKYPESNVFVTSHEVSDVNGSKIQSNLYLKNYFDDFETEDMLGLLNITSYGVIHTNSMCVRKSAFFRYGVFFEPGIRIGEDSDVWYRLALKNKAAISKQCTTSYRREFSTATQNGTHVHNWIFASRADSILSDDNITDSVKLSVLNLIDRYKMTGSRVYMTESNRKEAKTILSEIKKKNNIRFVLTSIFTFLPYSVCRKLLK